MSQGGGCAASGGLCGSLGLPNRQSATSVTSGSSCMISCGYLTTGDQEKDPNNKGHMTKAWGKYQKVRSFQEAGVRGTGRTSRWRGRLVGGPCASSTGPCVLYGSILRVQGQGTGTWEQRTTALWSALHASGLQAFSLLSSFPHSCHHLPHLFHPTTCEGLTWAARILAQGPAGGHTAGVPTAVLVGHLEHGQAEPASSHGVG